MKKIKIVNLNTVSSGFGSCFEVSILNRNRDIFISLLRFSSCRSWMCDNLFTQKSGSKAKTSYPFSEPLNIESGNTYIAVKTTKEGIENTLKNLEWLNKKEEQAGVKKSVIFATQNPYIFIVAGAGHWKNSCWKMMLYTFYIKCMTCKIPTNCDFSYWEPLLYKDNEAKLLGNVKMKKEKEIFCTSVYGKGLLYGVHDKEGFRSICSGRNPPMAKLLGVSPCEI